MELTELVALLHSELQLYWTWSFVVYSAVVLFLTWQLYRILIKPLLNPLLKQLPNKPLRPFVGNFLEIAKEEAIAPYSRWVNEYKASLIVYHGFFGSVRILSADRDFMKHVLVTNTRNYPKPAFLFRRLREIIGNGLVTSEGEVHHTHRKLCNGSFRQSILQNFVPVVEKYSQGMSELWLKKVQENIGQEYTQISPTDNLTCMTLDTIGECAFGYHFNSLNNPEAADVLAFQRMLGVFGFSFKLLIPFFNYLPTAEKRQWDSDLKLINSCVTTVITDKKKILSTITEDDQVSDLLTSLLMARDEATGEGLSSQEIRDEVFTFMVAGHETTSSALLWCLLCLSQNTDIQERLREEVNTVSAPLTWDKVEQLRYLTAVVKETLRLYPPVSTTFRQAQNHDRFGDIFIPQGTMINISIGALHRNPEYWDDPMTFNPDRFMDDTTVKPYTFLPFIAGPRMCIGYKFALMEMKVALLVLLQKLKFHPIPGKTYKCKQRITMRPNPNLELGVSEVK